MIRRPESIGFSARKSETPSWYSRHSVSPSTAASRLTISDRQARDLNALAGRAFTRTSRAHPPPTGRAARTGYRQHDRPRLFDRYRYGRVERLAPKHGLT